MHVTGLRQLTTGEVLPFDPTAYAQQTGDLDPPVLDVLYDYENAGRELRHAGGRNSSRADLFRWMPLLPVKHPGPVLPAGDTPLVHAPRLARRFGLRTLYLKDETRNPTHCLKDRATAIGMTMAIEQGHSAVYCASAGNAAISLAGFAAHAGLACHAYVPSVASRTRIAWLERFGAEVHVSAGNYDQAFDESETEGRRHGWYSRNCALNPFLVEGKKTCGLEIAVQLEGRAPEWVIAPSGDGCTLGAIGKGFREAIEIEILDELPHLIGVQASAIQPLTRRFTGKTIDNGNGNGNGNTKAHSIAVRRPRNAIRLLNEIEQSNGRMLAVSDHEIAVAQDLLAREAGIVAEFTSASTLAALGQLAEEQSLEGQTAILIITGGRLDEND